MFLSLISATIIAGGAGLIPVSAATSDSATLAHVCQTQAQPATTITAAVTSNGYGLCNWSDTYTGGQWVFAQQHGAWVGIGGGGGAVNASILTHLYHVPTATAQALTAALPHAARLALHGTRASHTNQPTSQQHSVTAVRGIHAPASGRLASNGALAACRQAVDRLGLANATIARAPRSHTYVACFYVTATRSGTAVLQQRGRTYTTLSYGWGFPNFDALEHSKHLPHADAQVLEAALLAP